MYNVRSHLPRSSIILCDITLHPPEASEHLLRYQSTLHLIRRTRQLIYSPHLSYHLSYIICILS